jgi:hypothetical protein
MNDLNNSINVLSAIFFTAMDKGYVIFANEVKVHLLELIKVQTEEVAKNNKKLESYKDIYVEIRSGCLQSVYGDKLSDEVNFILRDIDNIDAGEPDPLPENHKEFLFYW